MARTLSSLKFLSLCMLAHASLAVAQQAAPQPAPSQAPPKLERIEPGSDVPATTIPPRPRTEITEIRRGGQVVEAHVRSGPSEYVLKPSETPPGNAATRSVEVPNTTRPAQWQVLEWNTKKQPTPGQATAEPAAQAEAPPPPRPGQK